MEVRVSEFSGFCYGVNRAVEMVERAVAEGVRPIYTYGELIHNPQVVKWLEERGVKAISDIDEADGGTLVIRSHGVRPEVIDQALARGLKVIDATCTYVRRVHEKVELLAKEGYLVVILGEKGHPEVEGIKARAGEKSAIVEGIEEAEGIRAGKIGVVAQTTQPMEKLVALASALVARSTETRVFATVCDATKRRQQGAVELAREVDVMIVVGGRNSANTRRLHELCKSVNPCSYHIETAGEIESLDLKGARVAGVVAGASTPSWIVEEVVRVLQKM